MVLEQEQKAALEQRTSGNFMYVKEIYTDCDTDTLLLLAEPAGPACHTGAVSCFYEKLEEIQ